MNEHKFVKDPESKAIINQDRELYDACLRRKKKSEKINHLEERVNGMEEKLDLILEMLSKK